MKGKLGRGTSADEKNPILGFVERGGLAQIQVVDNVQQKTIEPIMKSSIQFGTLIYTDDYNIYNKVAEWGYLHKTVNHAEKEYARDEDEDEDGDGFCEVHCNTQ